jgi:hypothetical protein
MWRPTQPSAGRTGQVEVDDRVENLIFDPCLRVHFEGIHALQPGVRASGGTGDNRAKVVRLRMIQARRFRAFKCLAEDRRGAGGIAHLGAEIAECELPRSSQSGRLANWTATWAGSARPARSPASGPFLTRTLACALFPVVSLVSTL